MCITCQQHSRQGAKRPSGGQRRTVGHRARGQQRDVNVSGTRRDAVAGEEEAAGSGVCRSQGPSSLPHQPHTRVSFLLLKWASPWLLRGKGILGEVAKPCRWHLTVGRLENELSTGRNSSLAANKLSHSQMHVHIHSHAGTHSHSHTQSGPPCSHLSSDLHCLLPVPLKIHPHQKAWLHPTSQTRKLPQRGKLFHCFSPSEKTTVHSG